MDVEGAYDRVEDSVWGGIGCGIRVRQREGGRKEMSVQG